MRSTLFQIRKNPKKLFSDKLTSCNLEIVFTSPVRGKSFFTFKDKLPTMLLLGLAYKYKCGGWNANYYGMTKRHIMVWPSPNLLTFRHFTINIDNNKLTVIQEHFLCCNYSPFYEHFSILTRKNNDFKLKIMERLLIASEKPLVLKERIPPSFQYNFNIMSAAIMWCFITSYDVHLWHYAYK